MVYELNEPSKAAPLFADWKDLDVGIVACLDNVMGRIFADDTEHPKSAMAVQGDFVYFAGEPNLELVRAMPDRWILAVPQNEAWDAANKMSVRLAEKLGYEFSGEYVCYGLE